MTPDDFRALALALPESAESSHMGQADFRVRNKIFATLPDLDKDLRDRGMVKLTPEQQALYVAEHAAFHPVPGGWGKGGATYVQLDTADAAIVRRAIETAWRNTAPKTLAATFTPRD